MSLTVPTVQVHPSVVQAIRDHGGRQARKGGYEAVGFVASKRGRGVATVPLNNHSPDPEHGFFVEPWEQYRAENKLTREGYEILGVYHSHVNSEALPSQTDHVGARAWEGCYIFIYSVVFDDLQAYGLVDGYLEPVELVVAKGKSNGDPE